MVLESTVICFDNSDYQRNGDYIPSRLSVQKDGTNLICMSKIRGNPENNVSLITIASTVDVLCTLTSDLGYLYTKIQTIQPKGNEIKFITGVRIAHLLLKHRQSKNHKMRVVIFVGSPLREVPDDMQKLAKRLKKEKVNVDVVNFGNHGTNDTILMDFIHTLNGRDGTGSHLLSIPRGSKFSDNLLKSPIIQGEDGSGASGLTSEAVQLGFDPNEDPELALALRLSMEEERARERQQSTEVVTTNENDLSSAPAENSQSNSSPQSIISNSISTMNADWDDIPPNLSISSTDFANMTEEEQIAFAIQMSLQDPRDIHPEDSFADDTNYENIENVLRSLPGIDPQSEDVQETLNSETDQQQTNPHNHDKKNKK